LFIICCAIVGAAPAKASEATVASSAMRENFMSISILFFVPLSGLQTEIRPRAAADAGGIRKTAEQAKATPESFQITAGNPPLPKRSALAKL
jgi:hypothetical protein